MAISVTGFIKDLAVSFASWTAGGLVASRFSTDERTITNVKFVSLVLGNLLFRQGEKSETEHEAEKPSQKTAPNNELSYRNDHAKAILSRQEETHSADRHI